MKKVQIYSILVFAAFGAWIYCKPSAPKIDGRLDEIIRRGRLIYVCHKDDGAFRVRSILRDTGITEYSVRIGDIVRLNSQILNPQDNKLSATIVVIAEAIDIEPARGINLRQSEIAVDEEAKLVPFGVKFADFVAKVRGP